MNELLTTAIEAVPGEKLLEETYHWSRPMPDAECTYSGTAHRAADQASTSNGGSGWAWRTGSV
ncbi:MULTISPECIES: hypothetical protein [unclassified Streptomyces]|uniref:hypothetical protein n=1 Tax=unclassified Streptomyces TaxID=2593676 RepID=UPI0004C765B8|nr:MULTISPECIES: hypothetical protein [unclassified Streptomyces]KOV76517.1 hypothetical protein ADL02_30915 [Streptomyces sp. NRRL WC-3723]